MPVDPHLGDDWTSAHTDPAAELAALRRDVRRLQQARHKHEWEGFNAAAGDTEILVRSTCHCGAERTDTYATMDVSVYGPMVGRLLTTRITEPNHAPP